MLEYPDIVKDMHGHVMHELGNALKSVSIIDLAGILDRLAGIATAISVVAIEFFRKNRSNFINTVHQRRSRLYVRTR